MFKSGEKGFYNVQRGVAVSLIVACIAVGSTAAHAQFAVSRISLQFAWGIAATSEGSAYLFLDGRFTKPMKAVTLVAYNPKTGEEKILLDKTSLGAGQMFLIDRSHGWAWHFGEQLAVIVNDQSPVIVEVPLRGSFEWKLALDYTQARARGAGLSTRSLSDDNKETHREYPQPNDRSTQETPQEASREYMEFQQWIASVQAQQMQEQWNRTFGTMPSPGMDNDLMSPYGPMTTSPDTSLPQDITCPLCNGSRFYGKTAAPNYGYGPTTYVDTPCPRCGGAGHISR